jgi:hypothetical protein
MSTDFVNALKDEIASLQEELKGDPRYLRLQRLLLVLETYVDDPAPTEPEPPVATSGSNGSPSAAAPRSRPRTERTQAILDLAVYIIRERGGPVPTSAVLEEIQKRGVTVHGHRPANNLSAILSYSKLFQSHGRAGWTLADPSAPAKNTEAEDEPRLAGRSSPASAEHRPTSGGPSGPVNPRPGGGT